MEQIGFKELFTDYYLFYLYHKSTVNYGTFSNLRNAKLFYSKNPLIKWIYETIPMIDYKKGP